MNPFGCGGVPVNESAVRERLNDALQLLRRLEYVRDGATMVKNGHLDDMKPYGVCPCCGWPQEGHGGPGRYKGNSENTHEAGCSLDAVLRGEPAPRLAAGKDSWRAALVGGRQTEEPE